MERVGVGKMERAGKGEIRNGERRDGRDRDGGCRDGSSGEIEREGEMDRRGEIERAGGNGAMITAGLAVNVSFHGGNLSKRGNSSYSRLFRHVWYKQVGVRGHSAQRCIQVRLWTSGDGTHNLWARSQSA